MMERTMQLSDLVNTYSGSMQRRYGEKVYRVGVSTGIACPHRQRGGCIFCNPASFRGDYQSQDLPVEEQLKKGIEIISRNCGAQAFIAYFQDETSTAGDLNYLQDQYERAINYTGIKGLAISTRPDQVDEQVGRILSNLEKPVSLEIGMQSRHESSLGYLQRGHTHTDTINALRLCEEYEIEAGVHLMIGIPGEELEDILSTIKWVSAQKVICEVKLHNLVIYHGTKLAEMWQQGLVRQMPIDEYIEQLTEVLGWLREDIVVSRLFTSNILHNDLAVVKQEGNKPKWLNRLKNRLLDKSYRQGCLLGGQIIIDGNTG